MKTIVLACSYRFEDFILLITISMAAMPKPWFIFRIDTSLDTAGLTC